MATQIDCGTETSILIAMRSHLYPSHGASPRPPSSFNPMDLGIPLDLSQPSPPESDPSAEWESWGPEATIELCEVYLGFDGACISMLGEYLDIFAHFWRLLCRSCCKASATYISFFWTTLNGIVVHLHSPTGFKVIGTIFEEQPTIKTDEWYSGSSSRPDLSGCQFSGFWQLWVTLKKIKNMKGFPYWAISND